MRLSTLEIYGGKPESAETVLVYVPGKERGIRASELANFLRLDGVVYVSASVWRRHAQLCCPSHADPSDSFWISDAVTVVSNLIDDLLARVNKRAHIVLVGVREGASVVAEYLYRNSTQLDAVAFLNGVALSEKNVAEYCVEDLEGLPMLITLRDLEARVLMQKAWEAAVIFEDMGAQVDIRVYPNDGLIEEGYEIQALGSLMQRQLRIKGESFNAYH
ncbi:hypothetical protein ONV78_13810 [Hahella sp. CR1]|uniref:hypothetical protein n=1 Tax=Hahella sp. CR1 TaxID=2992807 RepID=UPI00244247D5|nr:hypothetical protein [Hahella sp. CR1]MDG9668814.1 hypothetical protein [Hahella sp. CR1]